MTKTAKHTELNMEFFTWCNEQYPGCVIDNSEGRGRVYITPHLRHGTIEYHLSRHDVFKFTWLPDDYVNEVIEKMELKLEELCRKYDL